MPYLLVIKKDSRIFGGNYKSRKLEVRSGTHHSQNR